MTSARNDLLLALAIGIMAATAGAELLRVEMSHSALDFEGAGGLAYDAGSDGFTIDAAVTSLKVDQDTRALPAGATLRIRLRVGGAGVAAGGAADQDLEVAGSLDLDGDGVAEYASPLLTGTFHGFGYENGVPDKFDFRFQVTGGSMAGVFGDMIGVAAASANSTFTGRFDASFAGDALGTLGSVAGSPAGGIDLLPAAGAADGGPAPVGAPGGVTADDIYTTTGVKGGLVVHVPCGNGQLTADLHKGDQFLVHGIDTDAADVQAARDHIAGQGLYGPVSADRFAGDRLPYVDELVRLIVIEDLGALTMDEVMRVLAPEGVAYLWNGSAWEMHVKPRPPEIDDWPQCLYDSSNNAVSNDMLVGPPRHLQWVGSPRWSRYHDRMASVTVMIEDAGRLFYIMDEGPTSSIILPSNWNLVARDAFNGTILWKRQIRNWTPQLWAFKSGPAQPSRRLVTDGAYVYTTLGIDDPLVKLDAIDGRTVLTCDGANGTADTRTAEEIVLAGGTLFCLVCDPPTWNPQFISIYRDQGAERDRIATEWAWKGEVQKIVAVNAADGHELWTIQDSVVPLTLAADDTSVYYHDGTKVVCRYRADEAGAGAGEVRWVSVPIAQNAQVAPKHGGILVIHGDYVLYVDSDKPTDNTANTVTCLRRTTGEKLWEAAHREGGHHSADDLLVIGDATPLAWSGDIANASQNGRFDGLSLLDGTVGQTFLPDYQSAEFPAGWTAYYMHHRCHRIRATQRYILASRTGTEYIDPATQKWTVNHWIRSGCLYGLIPANGFTYVSPTDCACYLQAKMYGFRAVAAESASRASPGAVPDAGRLEEGPAYAEAISGSPGPADWPTYRHDASRSGATASSVGPAIRPRWRKQVGGTLSGLTAAEGRLYVCSVNQHRLVALDPDTGGPVWSYTVGGRIDSPPTVHDGRVLFGCRDGYVYCLRATDGELVWRFRAAPRDDRLSAWEQVESVWPLHGSVLVQDDGTNGPVVYALAGRSMFLDGGLRMLRLDPATGTKISETIMDHLVPGTSNNLQTLMETNTQRMPVGLPDILSCDGTYIYMRAQRFDFQGVRSGLARYDVADQTGEGAHLFCSTGFLDGDWFHRAYFIHGKDHAEGAGGWPKAGQNTLAAGRLLVCDGGSIYGYGRQHDYYKWTTPIEYHLFGTVVPLTGYIEVANTTSLDPTGKPVTVEAWAKPTAGDGVVVSRGGASHGYVIYLAGGVPTFAVRSNKTLFEVAAGGAIPMGAWCHLVGVLAADGKIRLYVNGALAGGPVDAGLITSTPGEAMQIGCDLGNNGIGAYATPNGYNGTIDQVRVYFRALSDADINNHYTAPAAVPDTDPDQPIYLSFNAGTAADDSGNGNDGSVLGAKVTAAGKVGKAFTFENAAGSGTYTWSREVPFLARAMCKAGDFLYVAGPPDVVDEEDAFDRFADRRMQARLRQQVLALGGAIGGVMHVVSPATGDTLAEHRLSVTPAWDGMIAANGRIYMAMTDGTVLCYEPR